jgi:ribonuclease HIII
VGDIIEIQAESKYPEVAAASIIARAHALKQLHDLSKKAGFLIPKGSAHVQHALDELKKRDLPPTDFVKLKFSNVKKLFG